MITTFLLPLIMHPGNRERHKADYYPLLLTATTGTRAPEKVTDEPRYIAYSFCPVLNKPEFFSTDFNKTQYIISRAARAGLLHAYGQMDRLTKRS